MIAVGLSGANIGSMPRPVRNADPRATWTSAEIAAAMTLARTTSPSDAGVAVVAMVVVISQALI
jgi:hypothetical protein